VKTNCLLFIRIADFLLRLFLGFVFSDVFFKPMLASFFFLQAGRCQLVGADDFLLLYIL
jgi:hypothetical protein